MNIEMVIDESVVTVPGQTKRKVSWLGLARRLGRRLLRMTERAPRQLRLAETLSLGERRFVAVIEFERARFLVGGTSASMVLLAQLPDGSQEVNSCFKSGVRGTRECH